LALLEFAQIIQRVLQSNHFSSSLDSRNWQANGYLAQERHLKTQSLRCLISQANVEMSYLSGFLVRFATVNFTQHKSVSGNHFPPKQPGYFNHNKSTLRIPKARNKTMWLSSRNNKRPIAWFCSLTASLASEL